MKRTILILTALLALLTTNTITSQAQETSTLTIKITKNEWTESTNTLEVYGLGTNPNAIPVKFLGFDKNQQFVVESSNYAFKPDGTFHASLSDAKKEIRFVKIVNIPQVAVTAATPQPEVSASPKIEVVSTPRVLTQVQKDKINHIGYTFPTELPGSSNFGFSVTGIIVLGIATVAYFLPCILAAARRHRKIVFIFLVNLFFGWSVLGWIVALVWALRANGAPKAVAEPPDLPNPVIT